MSTPFVGEMRMFAGNFAPINWAMCNGQTIAISQNETLFALLGTIYGGDGVNTFMLPNMQGRLPVHWGTGQGLSSYTIGEVTGSETVTLNVLQMPTHTHSLQASSATGHLADPTGRYVAGDRDFMAFDGSGQFDNTMQPSTITSSGGSQPHENMPPFLCLTFIIAQFGIFPSQN
jgi:microcystin-dependent protein